MKNHTAPDTETKKPDLSIVIPAFNEEKHISSCLDSIIQQKTSYRFEVILCDNNSTDRTNAIVQSYTRKLPLRLIGEKEKGAAAARALGFEAAIAPIVFTTDADTIVPRDWIESFMPYFADPRVVAVTSPCRIDHPSRWNRFVFFFVQMTSMYLYRFFMGYFWISGYSYAVRKDAYNKAGKINTKIGAMDDFELSRRIHKLGKIVFLRDIIVTSSYRRYKNDVIIGLLSYPKAFLKMKLLGQESVALKDVR